VAVVLVVFVQELGFLSQQELHTQLQLVAAVTLAQETL
jgi:hypothetical protein